MEFITGLYDHQVRCVEKLQQLKVGALFMEQGTGKTRTALELIRRKLLKGRIDHVIWLCPCSVKENLRRDIKKHTGSEQRDLITICGIETLSTSIKWNSKLLAMVETQRCMLIVDESSKIKNPRAKRTENITRLAGKCPYRYILNGTPITRNEADLYSQMYILDWRILGYKSYWSFAANHLEIDDTGRIRNCLNTDYLVKKIAPYAYQVKKSECLDLPRKTYDIEYYDIDDDQREHYEEIANQLLLDIDMDEMRPETIYKFLTALQLIICGYKLTLKGEYNKIIKEPFYKDFRNNPRLQHLMDVIEGITEKCIIFCKYTDEIEQITQMLHEAGKSAVKFYGEMNLKQRQESIDRFEKDVQFFVANKTCAGFGLNLQFCSYVIFYSNDYDFGTRAQAEDRVHRIGQERNVHIIDICAAYTLDERILKCLNGKENLLDSFKRDLEQQKDKKQEFIDMYIYKRDYKGRNKAKRKTVSTKDEAYNSLKEGENEGIRQ